MLRRSSKGGDGAISAAQVLRHLAGIEEDGIEFYRGVLQGTQSDWVRKLAKMMLRAEERHRERFLGYAQRAELAADSDENALVQPLPAELAHLVRSKIFAPGGMAKKSVQYARDEEVIQVAIRAEESVALLLTQFRQYVSSRQQSYVDQVIKEEWGHKEKLEKVMRKYFS